jgi:hypothetical protein
MKKSRSEDRRNIVDKTPGPGSPWLLELYELFAPARESLKGYSEREINDAIDEALREVRKERRRASGG